MQTDRDKLYQSYFQNRNISVNRYKDYRLPHYFLKYIPSDRNIKVLDIGCGFGQMLSALKEIGYTNLKGIDILPEAVDHCRSKGLNVERIDDITSFSPANEQKYDLVVMSHVLEHIPKEKTIETLTHIKKNILNQNGALFMMVPNAQSHTGAYWMYEDFTHYTLFTTGSALYVLRSAGFTDIVFADADGTESAGTWYGKLIRKTFLKLYNLKMDFWNKITLSTFHRESPRIFSFELKILAK